MGNSKLQNPRSEKSWLNNIQIFHTQNLWLWNDIFFPFITSRALLLLVGWFSQYFPLNINYPIPQAVERGWHFSPYRLLDIWGRWDAGWYMSITTQGYSVNGNLATSQSNLAFFPLYPYLVRGLSLLLPKSLYSQSAILLIGIVISNLFFFAALIMLWKLIKEIGWEVEIARRSVLYILFFPTGFFFSCFYTEAAFLFFSVAAFYSALKKSWALAGLFGGLLALTRPHGILIMIPIVWLYLDAIEWNFKQIRWNLTWLMLIPAGSLTYILGIYSLSRNFLAPLTVQAAWNKSFVLPWVTMLNPTKETPFITPIDQICTLGFLIICIYSFLIFRSKSFGIYTILLVAPTLFTGSLESSTRYMTVIFPAFFVLAVLGRHKWVDMILLLIFITFQVLFMAAWSQFYWVA